MNENEKNPPREGGFFLCFAINRRIPMQPPFPIESAPQFRAFPAAPGLHATEEISPNLADRHPAQYRTLGCLQQRGIALDVVQRHGLCTKATFELRANFGT